MLTTFGIALALLSGGGAGQQLPVRIDGAPQVRAVGQTRVRLNRAYDRLCAPPLDNLDFVLADVSLRMTRRFTNYSGDISGRMIGALGAAQPLLGRRASLLSALLAELPKYQKPDGHFGADQDLHHLVQIRDMPILWGNGRLLLALSERCLAHPEPALLAVAKRLGQYIVSTRPIYGKKENFQHVGGVAASGYTTCYPSMVDGLAALGRVTNDKRFYDEGRFIGHLSLLDKAFYKHHSHGRLVTYRGMLDVDRLTRTHDFTGAVQQGCKHVADKYVMPTGGVPEYFDRAYPRDEGCSEADWIRVHFLLWAATGDTAYLDTAEHALRNHLLAMQFSNGGFGHRDFTTLSYRGKRYPYAAVRPGGADSYWCCSMHCTQLLADTARWAILPAGRDVFVTWLAESRAVLQLGADTLVLTVRQKAHDQWTLTVQARKPTEATIHLRVPGWARWIKVDGKAIPADGGWADVTRVWKRSTELSVTLPNDVRLQGVYTTSRHADEPARIFAGADLFCLPDASVRDAMLDGQTIPIIYISAKHSTGGAIPIVLESADGKRRATRLVPMRQRPLGGAHYVFDVRSIRLAEFKAMCETAAAERKPRYHVEMAFACDGTCDVYLNDKFVGRQQGWQNGDRLVAFTDRPNSTVSLIVHSQSKRPGLIGLIWRGKHTDATQTSSWSVVPVPKQVNAEAFVKASHDKATTQKLKDLGAFGVAPWKYIPGLYLESGAHWVWPASDVPGSNQRWLLQRAITVQ